jgi:sRNA-binding protein
MADKKMTAREFYNAVIGGKITDKEIEYAREAILKLDKKNDKRRTAEGEIKEENKPIAEAILSALANGSMTSPDLAKSIGQTTQKTNGVAGEMVKLGMLTKTKVKVKGKGELTSYSLATTDVEGSGVEGE